MLRTAFAATLALLFCSTASAQTERVLEITNGGLVYSDVEDRAAVTLKSRHFRLEGAGNAGFVGGFEPAFCGCLPGQTYSLGGIWLGSDFGGVVTVDKTTYEVG